MMETPRTGLRFTLIGSLIALLAQVMIAPNIAFFGIVPNFILGFVVLNAMLNTNVRSSLTGFFLGLLYDFLSQGPLGVMSLVLAVLGYVVSSLNKELFSGSWAARAILLLVAAFFGELFHAALLSITGYDGDFLASFLMRVLPGSVYDAVFGLVVFPLMYRFGERRRKSPDILKGKLD
jgi:rod shape-determining protein MreD